MKCEVGHERRRHHDWSEWGNIEDATKISTIGSVLGSMMNTTPTIMQFRTCNRCKLQQCKEVERL